MDVETNHDEDKEKEETDDILDKRAKVPPTRYARRAEKEQELIDDGVLPNYIHREEEDDILPLPTDMEEDPYSLNFSSEDEKEEEKEVVKEKPEPKKERKGKPKEFVFPTFDDNDDDHSEYELEDEEEEEEEEEEVAEKDKFGSPLFSDVEQDSEEEIINKKRKEKKTSDDTNARLKRAKPAHYSTIEDYLNKGKGTTDNSNSQDKSKKTVAKGKHRPYREVYTAGGGSVKYVLDENGEPVNDKTHEKTRVRKYAPKPGNKFNPYIIFNRMERQKIKDLNPEMDNHALSREVGRIYASLSPVSGLCRVNSLFSPKKIYV